jgi:glucoamylase
VADGKKCELVQPAYGRYVRNLQERQAIEVWKINRQIPKVRAGTRLRLQASSPFLLHWTVDEWQHYTDSQSVSTNLDIDFVDVPVSEKPSILRFTFLWLNENRWEGRDYEIDVHSRDAWDAIVNASSRDNERHYGVA